MTPEQLGRVREIYEHAASLTGAARIRFLNDACAGDELLRQEVERLLEARGREPDWLNLPALGAAKPLFQRQPPNLEGRQLSGYTLVREIGRGGMGCVYLAERTDGAFHKQAAVKLVLPSTNSAMLIERFQLEREILASLDHPNIARLLDGGVTEEGWPYFVMEYVEGKPIHQWCDEHKLNVSQRIELFRGVLAAVRYAHQRLVVHRDLKPGNILVTAEGTVKLLDFGIAKILSPDAAKAPDTLTLTAMMTPEYASPEQVNGTPITTLSDVYSLGVILYELLTGHRPYRLMSAAMHEMARVIAEVEPPRPSDVVTGTEPGESRDRDPITPEAVAVVREGDPNRLRKRLAGDLDSILLMSLRKEPEQRYGSVEALAGDLERHLDHRPVTAREATPWYRFRRFCRRNPDAIVAAALLAMPIGAGLFAVTWQTRRELLATHSLPAGTIPFIVFSFGIALVGLGVAIYLARPNRKRLLAAAAGGAVWTADFYFKTWLSHRLGWWESQVGDVPDPLSLLKPQNWILVVVAMTAVMFLVSWIRRRFGWRWLLVFFVAAGFYQISRERFWFSHVIPLVKYTPGFVPILTEAAIFGLGGLLAFLTMRWVERLTADARPAGGAQQNAGPSAAR